MLTENNMNLAGWMSVLVSGISLPMLALAILSGMIDSRAIYFVEALLNAGCMVANVYILINFRRVLHARCRFHDVDWHITLWIWSSLGTAVLMLITAPLRGQQEWFDILLSMALLVPMGVLVTVFGLKLLTCEDHLFGYLKPFAYMMIATGIMHATIVFALLGVVTNLIADLLLALIFFKTAKLFHSPATVEMLPPPHS